MPVKVQRLVKEMAEVTLPLPTALMSWPTLLRAVRTEPPAATTDAWLNQKLNEHKTSEMDASGTSLLEGRPAASNSECGVCPPLLVGRTSCGLDVSSKASLLEYGEQYKEEGAKIGTMRRTMRRTATDFPTTLLRLVMRRAKV